MNAYLLVKWLHIVSSVLLAGTGFGTAFYLFFANRSGNVSAIVVVSRLVVRADTWITTPTVIIQPLSGLWLMQAAGLSWQSGWLLKAIGLYFLAGACWLPVVWLQLRLRDMAETAEAAQTPLPQRYWRYARLWEALGYGGFLSVLGIFFLMVVKP